MLHWISRIKRQTGMMLAAVMVVGSTLGSIGAPVWAASADHVVISQVYGGGGNNGAEYKNDFIELYNPTDSPVTMTNWKVRYASAANPFDAANVTAIN
ncbi:lamin tail domain-containing protein, partial [Paenibacillus sp. MCAF20]